ncbi:MAG: GtrA family protein [Acidimicrobiales bacterium]
MSESPLNTIIRVLRSYAPRLIRYFGVTIVNVSTGMSLLVFFHGLLGWSGIASNVAAVSVSTVPAYLLSRRWVWGKSGPNSIGAEVAPFWAMAFAGLVLSTVMVGWASARFDYNLIVYAANLASFGVLWVVKFFVLEHLMWGPAPEAANLIEADSNPSIAAASIATTETDPQTGTLAA